MAYVLERVLGLWHREVKPNRAKFSVGYIDKVEKGRG